MRRRIRRADGERGHLPPLIIGADGEARYADVIGGHPVGIPMEPRFVSTRIRLGPGDTLVLYTDGLTEARVGGGAERYDNHGALLEFAAAHAPTTASAIVVAIQSLLDDFGSGVEDDVAVLALGVPFDTARHHPSIWPEIPRSMPACVAGGNTSRPSSSRRATSYARRRSCGVAAASDATRNKLWARASRCCASGESRCAADVLLRPRRYRMR